MKTTFKFKIEKGTKFIVLTKEESRSLYLQLRKMFRDEYCERELPVPECTIENVEPNILFQFNPAIEENENE